MNVPSPGSDNELEDLPDADFPQSPSSKSDDDRLPDAPPPPSPGYKSSPETDYSRWKIKLNEWPYDPQGIYDMMNTRVFNGTLPNIPVKWGTKEDTSGGFASTEARINCPIDKITNQSIRSNDVCSLSQDSDIKMYVTRFTEDPRNPFDHAQLISTIVHEAVHAYWYTHNKVVEGHGSNFRRLLYDACRKIGCDYDRALGDYQDDMREGFRDMRNLIRLVENLDVHDIQDCTVTEQGSWCPVHGMDECWAGVPVSETEKATDASAKLSNDPMADIRNADGTITISSHKFPTAADIKSKIDAFRRGIGQAMV